MDCTSVLLDYAGPIADDTPPVVLPDFHLPRDETPQLVRLMHIHDSHWDDTFQKDKPLKMRMAKYLIQVSRSSFCLLEEAMIHRDYKLYSRAAFNCVCKFDKKHGITVKTGRRQFYLPLHLVNIIGDMFLPTTNKKSTVDSNIKYFIKTLGYHQHKEHLIRQLLVEPLNRRLARTKLQCIVHCEVLGCPIRPYDRYDKLNLPFHQCSPTELCDNDECAECYMRIYE